MQCIVIAVFGVVFAFIAIGLVGMFDDLMRMHERIAFGSVEQWREDGVWERTTFILYFRVWRRTGTHSTALFD